MSSNSNEQSVQEYFDDLLDEVFYQIIRTDDYNVMFSGLSQFEILYHICRKFGLEIKKRHSRLFKLAMKYNRVRRHIFTVQLDERFRKEIAEEFERERKKQNDS